MWATQGSPLVGHPLKGKNVDEETPKRLRSVSRYVSKTSEQAHECRSG